MEPRETMRMQKETVIKDDGRRLIYYRFVAENPESEETAPQASQSEDR